MYRLTFMHNNRAIINEKLHISCGKLLKYVYLLIWHRGCVTCCKKLMMRKGDVYDRAARL